jgi:hypothetical protein
MVHHYQLLHACKYVKVANLNVIVDLAFARVYDTKADTDALAHPIIEEPPVANALEQRRQQRKAAQHCKLEFAGMMHLPSKPFMSFLLLRVRPQPACLPAPKVRNAE